MSKTEWRAVQDDDGWSVIYDVGESLVAIVAEDLDKPTAHRIAAVNELIEALEFIMREDDVHYGRDIGEAALAKARGEQ